MTQSLCSQEKHTHINALGASVSGKFVKNLKFKRKKRASYSRRVRGERERGESAHAHKTPEQNIFEEMFAFPSMNKKKWEKESQERKREFTFF